MDQVWKVTDEVAEYGIVAETAEEAEQYAVDDYAAEGEVKVEQVPEQEELTVACPDSVPPDLHEAKPKGGRIVGPFLVGTARQWADSYPVGALLYHTLD